MTVILSLQINIQNVSLLDINVEISISKSVHVDLCKAPKEFVDCATMCPPTCSLPEPEVCPRACDAKVLCQCPPGLVQVSYSDTTCVSPADCKGSETSSI